MRGRFYVMSKRGIGIFYRSFLRSSNVSFILLPTYAFKRQHNQYPIEKIQLQKRENRAVAASAAIERRRRLLG
jgi:hypothetical protein